MDHSIYPTANGPVESGREQKQFLHVCPNLIHIGKQVRTFIEDDGFGNLVASIHEQGLLEPVLLAMNGGDYILVAGERRVRACLKLGLESIPTFVIGRDLSSDEILFIQLSENLQRDGLNPIDEGKAYFMYLSKKLGSENIRYITNRIVLYDRRRKDMSERDVKAISTIELISGKTARSIQNLLKLLNLDAQMQSAIIQKNITVSQGYILSTNIDHPNIDKIFQSLLQNPKITNKKLREYFIEDDLGKKSEPISLYSKLRSIRRSIEKSGLQSKTEASQILNEIELIRQFVGRNE